MIDIDPANPVPLYLQIVEQMRRRIAMGALRPGDRLPTVRELAVRTRVNRNTAARAVQHLERDGWVRTRVGQGTFVEPASKRVDGPARRQLDESIDRILIESRTLGLPIDELLRRLERRDTRLRRQDMDQARDKEGR